MWLFVVRRLSGVFVGLLTLGSREALVVNNDVRFLPIPCLQKQLLNPYVTHKLLNIFASLLHPFQQRQAGLYATHPRNARIPLSIAHPARQISIPYPPLVALSTPHSSLYQGERRIENMELSNAAHNASCVDDTVQLCCLSCSAGFEGRVCFG